MFTNNYNMIQNLCAMKGTSKTDSIEDAVTNFNLRRMRKASGGGDFFLFTLYAKQKKRHRCIEEVTFK